MADLEEEPVNVKPQIIMKVDAPPEDNNTITSQGASNSSLDQNDTVKTPVKLKKPVLASSRLNNSPVLTTMRSSVLSSPKLNSGVVLRPSALASRLVENNKSTENSKNPFASNNGETPKFVPLVVTESSTTTTTSTLITQTTTTTTTPTSVASTSNFVFGQNLHERVVSESEDGGGGTGNASSTMGATNGTSSSEMLFSSAQQQVQKNTGTTSTSKSLSESAREYEESRANKRKYEAVTVVTGEEGEQNVLQLHCKLFAFDKDRGSWQERGRGTLRLNDQDTQQSRLVFRTSGSLRVVLNTKIWAEMTVDRASDKSLRLTAMDATGQIKVFLIMASGEEVTQLQRLLQVRVTQLRGDVQPPAGGEPVIKKKH